MGFLQRHNEHKAFERAEQQRVVGDMHRAALEEQLEEAKTFTGADISQVPGCPLQPKSNERIFLSAEGAYLIEPRKTAGHWDGRSQGVSVRVPGTRSMRYRIGASHGTFVQGEERPTPIDQGTFVITNQRAVFIGAKQTREWSWSRLIGFTHAEDAPWTAISVSNRQKTSGVLYDKQHEDQARFALDLAVARFNNSTDSLIAQIEGELAALPPDQPIPPG